MCCKTIEEQLSDYFDGELSETVSEEIRSHLQRCESCRSVIADFERIRGLAWNVRSGDSKAPPWSVMETRLQEAQSPVTPTDPSRHANRKSSRARDLVVIAASIAASVLILAWVRRPAEHSSLMAHSGQSHSHSHQGGDAASASEINFQDTVSLQRQDTLVAMQSLSKTYHGKEASLEQVEFDMGNKPIVESSLAGGARLVSTQLLQMPQCNCVDGECTCGPGQCNCVACVCERPDGSTFLVVEQCRGQKVNFGDLPVQLVRRGEHELQVSESDKGFAVTWKATRGRMTAFGLRDLNEVDQLLLAAN
ncbi:anti-sigma factor family protein [Novipirellula artificiosorum]|uniref:Putative zinc-finger domain-containing protein n=1 Tax=Novipirellula artificiosorum TaxID=2528016 RepID=A0A5C6DT08_9BACT|nr:zf-HC2 domain-containing protein [Novipirellula artificiosorum]TWU39435.1 hypothetical protein Poly41_22590 [Novipirellula artificiosorum]